MKMIVALIVVAALAVACGGGGGGSSSFGGAPLPPATPRPGILFGYFAQDSATVLETAPTTNALWTSGDVLDAMATLTMAKADGRKAVLAMNLCSLPVDQGEANAVWWLQHFHDAGLLGNVVAVSWCDEPNTSRDGDWNSADVLKMNAAVRRAMARFPELHAGLAVLYACRGGNYSGVEDFDWGAGCDDYDSGCGALTTFYPALRAAMGPLQRLILIVAGASPWRQNPACFVEYAEREPRVIAMFVFVWQTVTDGSTYAGVRENGMRSAYCAAGNELTMNNGACS